MARPWSGSNLWHSQRWGLNPGDRSPLELRGRDTSSPRTFRAPWESLLQQLPHVGLSQGPLIDPFLLFFNILSLGQATHSHGTCQ